MISKTRLILQILNGLNFILFLPLVFLDYVDSFVFLIIAIIIAVPSLILKRYDKQKFILIAKIYLDECDPEKYLIEYKKFLKRMVVSNNQKILTESTLALAHLSIGEISESKRILDSLVQYEPRFSPYIRFWYYKSWIIYFEETNEIERMRVLIQQSKTIIDNSPLKYKPQLISNYNHLIARYYVKNNIHLKLAESEFNKVFKGNFPKFNVVLNIYYLGLIAYLNKDYKTAKEYFKSVIRNGNKIGVVKKAKEYIEKIQNEVIVE